MPTAPANVFRQFHWEPQPRAQAFVSEMTALVTSRCPGAAVLANRMKNETGTRLIDWLDHIAVSKSDSVRNRLLEIGFEQRSQPGAPECFVHEGGMFPAVVLGEGNVTRLGVKVESVADFAAAWEIHEPIQGQPLSRFRTMQASAGEGAELWVVERHGYRGYSVPQFDDAKAVTMLRHAEALRRRKRNFGTDAESFAHTNNLVDAAIADLGVDLTCDLFYAGEREFWMRRNRAARVQKARQDKLGLGWANHDHHTYRSSRSSFSALVALWEKLGLRCRERFYAGAEAGWGAQVMEQPVTGIITFNDVDMSPEELLGDFAHSPMPAQEKLGTVGLWCGLHGEAALQAGMHHLEAQFDWHALRDQLEAEAGVKTMDPFTTFPYLRQAFTEGERWSVDPKRVDRLLVAGTITPEQAELFKSKGAIGSHLENLERNDGFKGFNQQGVSDIIAKTDPRRLTAAMAPGA
ncbi:MAG: hypothetical protein H7Y88_12525 [Phycisphaerales bacterium]|nr:hypothetical protein [Phycisphaerales bacterium]